MYRNRFHTRLHIFADIRDFQSCIHHDLKELKNSKLRKTGKKINNKKIFLTGQYDVFSFSF